MGHAQPGLYAGRTMTPNEFRFLPSDQDQIVPIKIDGTNGADGGNTGYTYELRAGWPMGIITASKLAVPCKRTTVTPSGGATAAAIPVVNAAAFRVGDTISVGGDTGKVISAIDYTTNTITVSGGSFTFANNEAVVAEDGSQICRGFLNEFAKLRNPYNLAAANVDATMLISGGVRPSKCYGDVAAIRADTGNKLQGIRWSDDHGQGT